MQRLIFGFIICISSCKVAQIPNNEVVLDNVKINLKLKNCIDIYKKDTVTFIIHNGNNVGFWIDSWDLLLDSITNENGIMVSSRSLVEKRPPDIAKYFWVEANSQIRISYSTDYFLRAHLKKLEEYYIYASYGNYAEPKKKSKEITLAEPVKIDCINFWTCP